MKIPSFLRRPSLEPAWTFTAPGVLWRLFPAQSGELIGESRDEEKKIVSFFAVEGRTGEQLWKGLTLDEPWWIGIEDVSEGVLLLHKYGTPDMPGHLGIIGVDLREGKLMWSNNELTFWFTHKQSVYAHRMSFEKRNIYEIDVRSGEVIQEIGSEEEAGLMRKREEALHDGVRDLVFPEKSLLTQFDPAIVKVVTREMGSPDRLSDLEFLVLNGFLVMNYHVRLGAPAGESVSFDNHLAILDMNRATLLFSDCINHNSPAVVPDSFFVRKGIVYYVKDQKVLTAVNLPQA